MRVFFRALAKPMAAVLLLRRAGKSREQVAHPVGHGSGQAVPVQISQFDRHRDVKTEQ